MPSSSEWSSLVLPIKTPTMLFFNALTASWLSYLMGGNINPTTTFTQGICSAHLVNQSSILRIPAAWRDCKRKLPL